MIEQDIEKKLVDAIELILPDTQVVGFWQPETTTTRKEPGLLNIKCNPRGVEVGSLPALICMVEFQILIPSEKDQKKLRIADWSSKLLTYLYTLNDYTVAQTALSGTGYKVQGAKLESGDSGFDTDTKVNYITTSLEVSITIC
jgi:hypothetical protein